MKDSQWWCRLAVDQRVGSPRSTRTGPAAVIAHGEDGQPLFLFAFGLSVTLPAVMLPHAVIRIGEACLTLLMWRFNTRRGWFLEAMKARIALLASSRPSFSHDGT